MTGTSDSVPFIPGTYSPWFTKFFGKHVAKMLRKDFHAVRVARGGAAWASLVGSIDAHEGPLIVAANHSAWWDPLVLLFVGQRLLPSRLGIAPMEASQLKKFAIFRKLGMFGIEPDDPRSMEKMGDYVAEHFRTQPRPTLFITPQGQFVDPRREIELRPGAAATASRAGDSCRVLTVAIEYIFWTDRNPELLLRFDEAVPETRTTTGWHRALVATMRGNAAALAEAAMTRDPANFDALVGGGATKTNPLYDLWMRLRGVESREIEDRRLKGAGRRE